MRPDPGNGGAIDETVDLFQCYRLSGGNGGGEAGAARRFDETVFDGRAEILHHPGGQTAATDRQDDVIGRAAHLIGDFDRDRGLAFDHVGIVEGGEEMAALGRAEPLCLGQRVVEIVADKPDLDRVAAEDPGLLDLLLRRGDRHEDHALHPEIGTHIGHALGMVAGGRADKELRRGVAIEHLAHRVEGAAQLVGAHRRQIFALEPDIAAKPFGKVNVALQRRVGEHLTHGTLGRAGPGMEILHEAHDPTECLKPPRPRKPRTLPCDTKPDIAHPTERGVNTCPRRRKLCWPIPAALIRRSS